jgi:hypothetical protein
MTKRPVELVSACEVVEHQNGAEPGARFAGIVALGCRIGGGRFVAGVRVGQCPAPENQRE